MRIMKKQAAFHSRLVANLPRENDCSTWTLDYIALALTKLLRFCGKAKTEPGVGAPVWNISVLLVGQCINITQVNNPSINGNDSSLIWKFSRVVFSYAMKEKSEKKNKQTNEQESTT